MYISSVSRLDCKVKLVLDAAPHLELPSTAVYRLDEKSNGESVVIERINAIRIDDKILNFYDHNLSITAEIDDKKYFIKETKLQLVRNDEHVYYISGAVLKRQNQRGAFRTQANYRAVLTNRNNHAAIDVRIMDISVSGIGVLLDNDIKYEVGTPVTVGIITDKADLNKRAQVVRVDGKVVRRTESRYPSKDLLGVKLDEKGIPAAYEKLVAAEQVRFRNGRGNAE